MFNKINLQTLRRPDGKYLLDVFDLKLVSNLKDLLKKGPENAQITSKIAFLEGNPDFNSIGTPAGGGNTNRGATEDTNDYTAPGSWRIPPETRGLKLSRLPGSEKEVQSIAALFQKNGWTVATALDKNATEEAVKKVKSPAVLHLATHGYFLENERKSRQTIGFEEQYVGQNPLLRSMLLFAGAQNALDGKPALLREDGILTAYEVQNLNLERTELVVLSACNSGLGKIENGEGVMGLQRAFRVAGAKTVIMSLWEADDAVTQLLMSTFYETWLAGKTKAEAFRTAQKRVKEKYPQPFFWGAFVMMNEARPK